MTDDPNSLAVQKTNWTTIFTIASISGIFIIFIVALWVAGFLTFTGSDPSSKVVAAALALVGGFVAAVVSVVGILLKYSIDHRTEARLAIEARRAAVERKIESERASALQSQAEQRLNLEAAIRAVELLGAEGDAGVAQRAGALIALSSLDQHQLTLGLATYLLTSGKLEPSIASNVLDRALKKGDLGVQNEAIDFLCDNAKLFVTRLNTHVPNSIIYWEGLSPYVQTWAPFALAQVLMCRSKSSWETQFRGDRNSILAALAIGWKLTSDDLTRNDVGAILKQVLAGFPELGPILHPKETIDIPRIRPQVEASRATSTFGVNIVTQLEAWSRGS